MMLSRLPLLVLTVAAVAHAGDPSSGWLSYVIAEESGTITKLSASMVVPDAPTRSGAEPAFWFGVQTAAGDGALIQPIMAKWIGDKYEAFHEIFDWTDRHDEAGEKLAVSPGDLITASVACVDETCRAYDMALASRDLGKQTSYRYALEDGQSAAETTAYFVLEHQPTGCAQYPPNGRALFTNVTLEVDGELVPEPAWRAEQESPACNSSAVVIDSQTLAITWDAAS